MYIVLLRFAESREGAGQHMEGHKKWIQEGFANKVLLLAGSVLPAEGGCVLADNCDRDELDAFLEKDPFVAEGVVKTEVIEVDPARADERLGFLVRD